MAGRVRLCGHGVGSDDTEEMRAARAEPSSELRGELTCPDCLNPLRPDVGSTRRNLRQRAGVRDESRHESRQGIVVEFVRLGAVVPC